ncbi:hypothetical protein AsAng_0052330 [Aureispira anguillae]|uniref:Uncharacterized protein n=1 Tax=Aureispira anguillae TaxID=2864201 RepID=A0A915YJW9_9BACT|nr:hypothetical protein AsAng_0052330 [Aureispira anguillae]
MLFAVDYSHFLISCTAYLAALPKHKTAISFLLQQLAAAKEA